MILYTTMISIWFYPYRVECCVVCFTSLQSNALTSLQSNALCESVRMNHWKQAILLPSRQQLESLVNFVRYDC